MCVCLGVRPARSPAPPGWGCGGGACAWASVAAAPRHSWLGCWGVCAFVSAPRLYPAIPGLGFALWACVLCSGLGCAPPLLVGLLVCVCVRACAPLAPPRSWQAGVSVCGFGFRLLSGFFLAYISWQYAPPLVPRGPGTIAGWTAEEVAELVRYVKLAGKTRGRREKRGTRPFSDLVGRAGRPRERGPEMDEAR